MGHRERLWPGPWAWAIGLGLPGALGVAYGAALSVPVGWGVGGALAIVAVLVLTRMACVVEVRRDGLAVGRAELPWAATGRVLALDGAATRRATGPEGDPTAYLTLRPGVGPGSVVVEVVDPDDPHGTWLVASRDSARMARAIVAARGTLTA